MQFLVRVTIHDVDDVSEDRVADELCDSIVSHADTSFYEDVECGECGAGHEESYDIVIRSAEVVSVAEIAREARPTTIGLPAHP